MRTTLTLDDDVARQLRDAARSNGQRFKDVVNATLRRGLSEGRKPLAPPRRFRVKPTDCGFRPGIDPFKLNQILDEIEMAAFERKFSREKRRK